MFYFKAVSFIDNCLHILCLLYLEVLKIFSFVLSQKFKSFVVWELEYPPFSHPMVLGSSNHLGEVQGMSSGV